MNLLLDTHALIWFGENAPQLSKKAVQAIEFPGNVKYISMATLWEMAIKRSLGKLQLNRPLKDIIDALQSNGFELLTFVPVHILQVEGLPFIHRDPFDRMLIAQALAEDLTIAGNEKLFDE
jgi:PIN domain nuclease of toxin-antitoxin system